RNGAELDVPVDLAVDLAQLPGRLQRLQPAAHVAVSNRFSFWRHTHPSPEVAAVPHAKRGGYGRFSGLDKGTVPRNYPLFIKSAAVATTAFSRPAHRTMPGGTSD